MIQTVNTAKKVHCLTICLKKFLKAKILLIIRKEKELKLTKASAQSLSVIS